MSEVRLIVRDAHREIQADRHGSFAEALVAALSAEPETLEELEAAMERFMVRPGRGFFDGFSEFFDDQPHDAGLVIVDLPGRLIVWDSNYASVAAMGEVSYHDGREATDVSVRYHLSEDWMITGDAEGWKAGAEERRLQRSQSPPLDGRAVLYGEPLLRFVAAECYDAFRDAGPAVPEEWGNPAYREEYDLVREIHIRWLMTPRDELRGETPRQFLLARRSFIGDDLQDREFQWSRLGSCPRGLDPDSAAYRLGGIGTHEAVIYYDLVRALLWHGRNDVAGRLSRPGGEAPTREQFVAGEVGRLAGFRESWLDSPYSEWGDETPRAIIHNERARIPAAGSGEDAMVDCDCPICQAQAEMPGPVFWHLDGSHMDDDFAFSLWHETEEEWEAEQAGNEIFNRRFEQRQAEQKRLGVEFPGSGYMDPDFAWRMSFSSRFYEEAPLRLRLFAIGEPLSELIADLLEAGPQGSPGGAGQGIDTDVIERLRTAFRQLDQAVDSTRPGRIDGVLISQLTEFASMLDSTAAACPAKSFECLELKNRLSRFLEPPRDMDEDELFNMESLRC